MQVASGGACICCTLLKAWCSSTTSLAHVWRRIELGRLRYRGPQGPEQARDAGHRRKWCSQAPKGRHRMQATRAHGVSKCQSAGQVHAPSTPLDWELVRLMKLPQAPERRARPYGPSREGRQSACTHACTCTHIQTYMLTRKHTHQHTTSQADTQNHADKHTHTHAHAHTHTHTFGPAQATRAASGPCCLRHARTSGSFHGCCTQWSSAGQRARALGQPLAGGRRGPCTRGCRGLRGVAQALQQGAREQADVGGGHAHTGEAAQRVRAHGVC